MRHTCEDCSVSYLSKGGLFKHKNKKHRHVTYNCRFPGCFRSFTTKESLTRHRKIVHSIGEDLPVLACSWNGCTKTFTDKRKLNRHIESVHKQEERLDCNLEGCLHFCYRWDHLEEHKRTCTKKTLEQRRKRKRNSGG